MAHRTAYHVLRSVGRVQPGDEVVVLGAGGGVGLAAVQLAAGLGATVTAVASSAEKLDVARTLGATRQIDHRSTDLRQALRELVPDGTDVVIDPVGGALAEPALRSLRYGGRFVTVGYASGEVPRIPLNLVLLKGIEIVGFQFIDFVGHHPDEWERNEAELMDLFTAGRAVPHIGAAFALDDAAAALRLVADGNAIGKVVIDVSVSYMYMPPLTPMIWPVIELPSSEQRKAQAPAMSAGVLARRIGTKSLTNVQRRDLAAGRRRAWAMGVSTIDGGIVLAVMPWGTGRRRSPW